MPNRLHELMGLPWVYDRLRPAVLGGIDTSAVYDAVAASSTDVVVDVGCGTGVALCHLAAYKEYHGFDTDGRAVQAARETHGKKPHTFFSNRELLAPDVTQLAPHVCVLSGLLHHLDDEACVALLQMLRQSSRLRRVSTLDVSFFPNKTLNNMLTVLDRGQYPRRPAGYIQLAKAAGYRVVREIISPSSPKSDRIQYWVMALEPEPEPEPGGQD